MLASSRSGEKNSGQPVCRVVLILDMFLAFRDYMRREVLIGGLLVILVAYVFYFGISVMRLETEEKVIKMKSDEKEFSNKIEIFLPAVEEEGDGTMAWLEVEINEGEGRVLLDIDDIFFLEDTQESVRIAKSVAEKTTNIDASIYDIIYSFNANASKIEGPSAGPAMAIATSVALKNKTINKSVTITGYLREDGTIGKVSGILEKAESAKQNQIKLLLIPVGQRIQTKIETEKNCENGILTTYCKTETISKKVDIQEEVGIDVIEIENISEALKYFIID